MSFVVFDHGYRIQTPSGKISPHRGVDRLNEIKPIHRSADAEDKVHADGPRFELPLELEQSKKRSIAAQAYSDTDEQAPPTQERPIIMASQIMSHPVVTVPASATVKRSWDRMQEMSLRYLVVINDDGNPLGVLSDRTLLLKGIESYATVDQLLTRKLIAAKPSTDVRRVALTLLEQGISSMPVVDDDDQVVGLVCRSDLLRLLISGAHTENWA